MRNGWFWLKVFILRYSTTEKVYLQQLPDYLFHKTQKKVFLIGVHITPCKIRNLWLLEIKKHSAQDHVRDKFRDFQRLQKRSNILKSHTK